MNFLHPMMLCASFGWNWRRGSGEIFRFHHCIFPFFVIISPWSMAWPFVWTNLNPLHKKMLCAKFGWNWSTASWGLDKNVTSNRFINKINIEHCIEFLWRPSSNTLGIGWCSKNSGPNVWKPATFLKPRSHWLMNTERMQKGHSGPPKFRGYRHPF